MPRKIENKLREGQASKIYFYAFPKPITGYELAKKITGKSRPFTARVYTTLTRMRKEDLIHKKEGQGYQSNPQPLVGEIEKQLKKQKVSLTENDKLCILGILQNDFFKETLSSTISEEREPREIDAVCEISYILAVASIVPYQSRRVMEKSILGRMTPKERQEYIGFIDQEVKALQSSTHPIDEFFHYAQHNLTRKLIRLLPVDLEKLWNIMEQVQQKIEKEVQQKIAKKRLPSLSENRKGVDDD